MGSGHHWKIFSISHPPNSDIAALFAKCSANKITSDFFQTLEVNADLLLNRGTDAKFLSDLSSYIQYECKNANILRFYE